jgi:hypothetical protein
VPQLSGHKDSGYKDNSAPWKSLISFGAPCWSGFPEHRTARAFDEAASPPTPPSGAASSGCQRGGDREARALAMEIPLDLERRLERRWVARFFRTKRIAVKCCMNRTPRPLKRDEVRLNRFGIHKSGDF